jgi:hypothetical protein
MTTLPRTALRITTTHRGGDRFPPRSIGRAAPVVDVPVPAGWMLVLVPAIGVSRALGYAVEIRGMVHESDVAPIHD